MSQITNMKNITQREGWNHHDMYILYGLWMSLMVGQTRTKVCIQELREK